ncbi:AAA family ATPase [Deltaproteobacteria bacterium OttesenSCG-928-M10]|nr:AAA family ATPase [Deltaproteobacteria bacterium OttesenSCG-928-M10]
MADYSLVKPSVRQIYETAKIFWHDCLENDGSLLFSENIWTLDNLQALKQDFIDSPDDGSDTFIDKFKSQLKKSAKAVILLAAEVMAAYYLFPVKSVGVQHKRNTISVILSWAGEGPIPEDRLIYQAFEDGIGNPGMGYNHSQFWELSLIINMAIAYKNASPQVRERLSEPWSFRDFINSIEIPDNKKIQGRNIWCHLFFPESFERITTTSQKEKIIHAFTGQNPDGPDHLDEKLLGIRKVEEEKCPGKILDFYMPPLSEIWHWGEPAPEPSMMKAFKKWMAKQPKSNGEPYSLATVGAYAGALKNATAKLKGLDGIWTNLFKYTDYEEFENIRQQILDAPNFEEVDVAAGNKAYSNGIKMYKRFLKDMESPEPEVQPGSSSHIPEASKLPTYSISTIIDDGCFIERSRLEIMLQRLSQKKNLILQGPPGTGKTWLAKRLAYALIGEKNTSCIKAVQFHPNLAYEDFIRGWRPCGDGKLKLEDGPFLKLLAEAVANPGAKYVLVVEEINRGQPAQIFGEMLTLLEADKRTPDEAMELCHCKQPGETVYVPENLYVIGTMNIADRSLALVDLALRRRFAFIDLEPLIDDTWFGWMKDNHSFDSHLLEDIQAKMLYINKTISDDASLGDQFRIGHSFVTPAPDMDIADGRKWFRQVVTTEIKPQLEEYWFDAPGQIADVVKKLLEGF